MRPICRAIIIVAIGMVLGLSVHGMAAEPPPPERPLTSTATAADVMVGGDGLVLSTVGQKVGYGVGLSVGQSAAKMCQPGPVDAGMLQAGFEDGLAGRARLGEQQIAQITEMFRALAQAAQSQQSESNGDAPDPAVADQSAVVGQDGLVLATLGQKIGYVFGLSIGGRVAAALGQAPIDQQALSDGIDDGLNDRSRLTKEQVDQLAVVTQAAAEQAKLEQQQQRLATAAEALAANQRSDGVIVTPSGLQYRVIAPGDGPRPAAEDWVRVHYRLAAMGGQVLDDTWRRDQSVELPVTGVFAGWQEVMQMMAAGARWEVWVPSDLAYGQQESRMGVPQNAVLHMEIELLSIEPQP